MPLLHLRRVRWAVRATLTLGVAASVAANVLHARPNPISQVIAAWPPLALLLTVELISRVPVHRRSLAAVRLVATSTIAGIAAWVSYWHLAGVAARYGETGPSAYLLPFSVDGLVIVASVSLVELAGRIRATEATEATVVASAVEPELAQAPATPPDAQPERPPARRTSQPRAAKSAPAKAAPAKAAPRKRAAAKAVDETKAGMDETKAGPDETKAGPDETAPGTAGRELSSAELVKLAELIKADRPKLTQAAIAAELGVTTQRLQQAKRQTVAA